MHEQALRELAAFHGITVEQAADVEEQPALEQYLLSLLQAANLPVTTAADAEKLLRQLRLRQWQRIIDPVHVVEERQMPLTLPLRLLSGTQREYSWTLTEEGGKQHSGSFRQDDLVIISHIEADSRDDSSYLLQSLALGVSLPLGYHELVISLQDFPEEATATSLVIVTPEKCYVPPGISDDKRIWGLSLHLHAVRSRTNWGIGDFSDLKRILGISAAAGAGTLHTAPLAACMATAGDSPEPPNPYSPSCRSLLHVLFIDVEAIEDFTECDAINEIIEQTEFQARLTMIKERDRIDYGEICEIKSRILKKLWEYFHANHLYPETSRGTEFRRFQKKRGETLRQFGLFSAIQEKFGSDEQYAAGWSSWPAVFRDCNSREVRDFAAGQEYETGYFHYLQWQAEMQLAAIGRRSMELGLKVGLVGEFPYGFHANGFEAWRYKDSLLNGAVVAGQPLDSPGNESAAGLPFFLPESLKQIRFRPFIEGLRRSMRYTGAIIINSFANYFQTYFELAGMDKRFRSFVSLPFRELLGIITLESKRNRCLVIADNVQLLPQELQQQVMERNIFPRKVFFQTRNDLGGWLGITDYPAKAVTSSSAPFLTTTNGFWNSRDLALQAAEQLFMDDAEREKAIVSRASDRVHFLISLDHEELLPEGYTVDQAGSREMDQSLITALQVFLARTPAKILLIAMNDLLGLEDQAEPPSLRCQKFWETAYPLDLEEIMGKPENISLFKALCRERGVGNVRPSALASDRKKRQGQPSPISFYRLQLHKDFTFQQAAAIIPYLRKLGISHCYVSPFLTARPGSSHGYDIIDHSTINPEIGKREDFESFLAVLEQQGMALILDIVPNHMGIGSDNKWWMDVLENGEASKYARFFDINWQPQQADLAGRLLLPILGDYYGKILENGELSIEFDDNSGSFSIRYYEHRFPVSPRTYPALLSYDLQRLENRLGEDHHSYQEFQNLIQSFANLPGYEEASPEMMQVRHRSKEVSKRTLARLCRQHSEIKRFIEENVILFNGMKDKPDSFDLLHALLDDQPYRLAFWRVAADEINYRRFFDINDLAALRMEDLEVFTETHKLIMDLVATGKLDGLRIDHPDGLYDPLQYFCRLQAVAAGEELRDSSQCSRDPEDPNTVPLYVVVEKVLADFESLPENWPISGTTGYEFSNLLNGLFIDPAAEKTMTLSYQRFIGTRIDYDRLLYDSKKLIIRSSMAGELNVLAGLLYRLARSNRRTRDLTFNSLRDGLIEVVCFFPVYRTYTSSGEIAERDAQFIEWALAKAISRQHLEDTNVFGFIKSVLLLEIQENDSQKRKYLNFVQKFQQYTGPVMAKGLEDTFFYRYNRLLSLNEVGGNPKCFGISVGAFHQTNQTRVRYWPHCMLNTSTHDSKRSEDVRARINVITETANEWHQSIKLWSLQNRSHKAKIDNNPAPSKNDEYAFYQNLVGAWPLEPLDDQGRTEFIERMKNMALKTSRESKMLTSWTNPNIDYEQALVRFVEASLDASNSPFLNDFLSFQQNVAWFGMLNSLSQVFLKLVSPGIPDIYQGNESWRFCLVDPDSRRPVDYKKRQSMIVSLLDQVDTEKVDLKTLQLDLLANLADGRAKMYIVVQTLRLRNSLNDLFSDGSYLPLEVTGSKDKHICAFAREKNNRVAIIVAPRLYLTLMQGKKELPFAGTVWQDTEIRLPEQLAGIKLRNIFSDASWYITVPEEGPLLLRVELLLQSWPVALLHGDAASAKKSE